jgi:lysine 2,3-aminomutase
MHPQDKPDNWHKGQGLWGDVPEAYWNDWTWQLRNRLHSIEDLDGLLELTPDEREGFEKTKGKLSFAITPHFFNLIDRSNPACPIRRQVIPLAAEAATSPGEHADPLDEDADMVAPGLVHRYPDRVLLLATDRCASYCRFCTRSRIVSGAGGQGFHADLGPAFDYIRSHEEVRDVLISGGDPLLLSDSRLEELIGRLRKIPHVEFVRIGTRVPVFLPQRVTPALCEVFRRNGPVWMSIHFNHPRECTQQTARACEMLSLCGVPMGSQTVLLRGINDDAETLRSLYHRLLMIRVRPYYLYQCDPVSGSAHLRTDPAKGVGIIRALRGFTSGYAVPQFVIDAPGGGGKIPINPDYIVSQKEGDIAMQNYEGLIYRYLSPTAPQPTAECLPCACAKKTVGRRSLIRDSDAS